jgi:hypothetical protein
MTEFKSVMKTYYFTVRHPETNELKIVRHPAASFELAEKLLVIKCGKQILDRVVSWKAN